MTWPARWPSSASAFRPAPVLVLWPANWPERYQIWPFAKYWRAAAGYRLGGVVDAAGTHVADDLEKWAEAELAVRDDDLGALCDDYADSGLTATRLTGRTHYLVASTGPAAVDFIQIEIEELQEMACHALFDADHPPGSIEELVDPRSDADACTNWRRAARCAFPRLAPPDAGG